MPVAGLTYIRGSRRGRLGRRYGRMTMRLIDEMRDIALRGVPEYKNAEVES